MEFREHLKELKKDKTFLQEFNDLAPEYELVRQIINARSENGMTQQDLALATGIPQAHISRIENGNYNPSLSYLKRIAGGLQKELHIYLK